MGRFSRSLSLLKASWQVIKADKELLILPILSMITTLIVAASFIVPIALTGNDLAFEDPGPVGYALLFVGYLVLSFITLFFNSALVHAANERLEGGDPTLGSALRGALMRVGRIFVWALVVATVSVIIRAIEERVGAIGRIFMAVLGVAWSLVTFLVIPVLIVEGIGVGDALKRSGQMFKQTWGENVVGQLGIGLVSMLLILPGILVLFILVNLGGAMAVIGIGAFMAWALLVILVTSALNAVFQTALYRYAAGLPVGGGFDESMMRAAFQPRKRGRNLEL